MGCAEHVIKRSKQQLIHGHEKIIVFLLRIQQQAPLEKKSHVSHFVCVPIVHSLKRKRYQLEAGGVTKQHVFHVHISSGPPPPSSSSPPLPHPSSSSSSRLVLILLLLPRLNPRLHPHPSPHPPPHPLVRSPASSSSSIIHPRTQPSFQDSIVDSFPCAFSLIAFTVYIGV